MSLCRVNTRAWCRAYAAPQPSGQGGPTSPLPSPGSALAEAYLPAPIAWTVQILSTNPGSNVQVSLEIAGIEGGWQTFGGLVTLPFLGGPVLAGRAVRAMFVSGQLAPGELISAMVAPVAWPAWAAPDEREFTTAPGLYR